MKVEFDSFPCAHKVYYVFCLQQKLLDSNFFSSQGKFFLCILGNSFYIMLEPLLLIWKAWLREISNNMVTMPIISCSSCSSQNDSWSQNCCKQDIKITQQLAYRTSWKFLTKYEINFLPQSALLTFLEKAGDTWWFGKQVKICLCWHCLCGRLLLDQFWHHSKQSKLLFNMKGIAIVKRKF